MRVKKVPTLTTLYNRLDRIDYALIDVDEARFYATHQPPDGDETGDWIRQAQKIRRGIRDIEAACKAHTDDLRILLAHIEKRLK